MFLCFSIFSNVVIFFATFCSSDAAGGLYIGFFFTFTTLFLLFELLGRY